ncbi:apolipoprotein N-acyltransferase [Crocosphaera sp. UHCC 0190]|uniref:apolipoprotein N-acyltransferase n=1 Tax=Crocosphaera sp. UHCC 0190 TaxID=3110246 RepID=UPI002B1F8E18|nr:apolipoprotein N-acyltransferase [Crocosphaera sp. UHCC 0190]MEA5510278.1 apolipoprotein N-acyltransferase [Crocosphaera sp. UHCC 0190]
MKILLVAFSGLLMGLTTAPFSAFYLAWIALIPLWLFTILDDKNNPKLTLKNFIFSPKTLMAFVWGFCYHGFALFWITGIHPMTWMGVPWLVSLFIAAFCWVFITVWGAILVTFWSFLIRWFNLKNTNKLGFKNGLIKAISRVIVGAAIWCLLELIWNQGALWWTSLSYTQSPHNLGILQLTKLSGYSTVTAAIVAVNGLIAESLILGQNNHKNKAQSLSLLITAILMFISLHLIGLLLYNQPIINNENQAIKVGIIQGNIPNTIKLYPEGWKKAIEGYTKGYETLAIQDVDLVITPETALPFDWNYIVNNSSFYTAILNKKVPVILGAFGSQGTSYTNSLLMITETGKILSRFDKVKLVPLGEYIPFENILGKIINRLSPLDSHLAAGKPDQIFKTPFGQAITGICYESAFSEHFRRQAKAGGEFIITASNNAHYSQIMPAQHHAQDIIRAIETDRWMARATNTGYSAIINPHGDTLWISDLNTYQLHQDTIYRRNTQTLYVKWGDWLSIILCLISGFLVLIKL